MKYFDIDNINIGNVIYNDNIIIDSITKNKNIVLIHFKNKTKTIKIEKINELKYKIRYKMLEFDLFNYEENITNIDFKINNINLINGKIIFTEKYLSIMDTKYNYKNINQLIFKDNFSDIENFKIYNVLDNIKIYKIFDIENKYFKFNENILNLNIPFIQLNNNIKFENIKFKIDMNKIEYDFNIGKTHINNYFFENIKIKTKDFENIKIKYKDKKNFLNIEYNNLKDKFLFKINKLILNKNLIKIKKITYKNGILFNKNFFIDFKNKKIVLNDNLIQYFKENNKFNKEFLFIKDKLKIENLNEISIGYDFKENIILYISHKKNYITLNNNILNIYLDNLNITKDFKSKNTNINLKIENDIIKIKEIKSNIIYKNDIKYNIYTNTPSTYNLKTNTLKINNINKSIDLKYENNILKINNKLNSKININNKYGDISLNKMEADFHDNYLKLFIEIYNMDVNINENLIKKFKEEETYLKNKKNIKNEKIDYKINISSITENNFIRFDNNNLKIKNFMYEMNNNSNSIVTKSNINISEGNFIYNNKKYKILPSTLNLINNNKIINSNILYKDKKVKVNISIIGNIENNKIFIIMNSEPKYSKINLISYLFLNGELDEENNEKTESSILKEGSKFFSKKFKLPIDSIDIQENEDNQKSYIFSKKINKKMKINLITNKKQENIELIYKLNNNFQLKSYKKEKSNGFFIEFKKKY